MQTPSRLEGVSLQRNYQRFSIRRNYGCVGGVCAFLASAFHHDVTSRGREIRWSTLQGHGGGFWQRQPENKQGRVWGSVFFFPFSSLLSIKHRAHLNLLTFDMAPSVTGCLAQGMCLWPSYFNARSARSCRQQLGLGLYGNFVTCTERTAAFELGFLIWVCTIVCAHLCHNREFLQPCRSHANAPRHACAALLIPSPKKAL